ncbi:hypothetical protein [Gemmatimonas aurantiaca]|uniref:phosphoribosyltransferase-like protein n=1 Tax=Gemmatimonas aurantiaca TaxID=173480 RepID=UPI00301D79EB
MNEELGLKLLANLLEWRDEARVEYQWLKFMARYKYDGYQDFVAGKRFLASLISWLRQFPTVAERRAAYCFMRERLVYLGPAEVNHLVRRTYHETIRPRLGRAVAARLDVPEYLIWSHPDAHETYNRLLRASLFFGLSDGARIDVFRRANTGIISNEQVLVAPQIHESKWKSVLKSLRKERGADAQFEFVFLLDDFTASGATLVRYDADDTEWTGKLVRFWEDVQPYLTTHFTANWTLGVHHYVASHDARTNIHQREALIRSEKPAAQWFGAPVEFTFGTVLPASLKLDPSRDSEFLALVDSYYDPAIETRHTDVGGDSVARGFGACALPLVLEHNTPNNSVALLWAESVGADGRHAMRPLFRRRQRHV